MSPVATSSLSPHATSSSSICKSGNRDDPVGLHHQDNKMTDPRDLMTSRLCSSPSALPPPTTLLELPVDHQGPPLCAGCRLRIVDKFYLCAVEAKWHAACLKCSDCGVELANQLSCFERDGNIYCKEDYIRWDNQDVNAIGPVYMWSYHIDIRDHTFKAFWWRDTSVIWSIF